MRKLTKEEIAGIIAKHPNCKVYAVENVLNNLEGISTYQKYQNMMSDAIAYRWNSHTVNAMKRGIELADR